MKRFYLGVVVGLACLSPSLALAQNAFDEHVADIAILQPRAVQNDLGITEKQRAELNRAANRQAKDVQAFLEEQKKKGVNPNSISPDNKRIVAFREELKASVVKTLTPAQLRRLREITLQARGYAELLDPVVQRRLSITSAQLGKIRAALEEFAKFAQQSSQDAYMGVRAQYQNVRPKDQADTDRLNKQFGEQVRAAMDAIRPKIQAAHVKMDQRVEAVLTREQRSNWIALLGKSFKSPGH